MEEQKIYANEYMYYLFDIYCNTMEYTLNHEVDGELLQKALDKTTEVFPWLKFSNRRDEADIYFVPCNEPYLVRHTEKPLPLGGKDFYGRNLSIEYWGNKIRLNYSHLLTDGFGRVCTMETLLYYYFSFKNKTEYDPAGIFTEQPEGMFFDPLENPYEIQEGVQRLPKHLYKDGFLFKEFLEALKGGYKGTKRYTVHADGKSFMEYVKAHNLSPAVLVSELFAKTAQKKNPDNKNDMLVSIPVNYRKRLGCETTFKNAFVSLIFPLEVSKLMEDDVGQGVQLKGEIKKYADSEQLKYAVNDVAEITRQAQSYKTKEERQAYYSEIWNKRLSTAGSFIVSYMGALRDMPYNNEINDVSLYGYAVVPLITMLEINGVFKITVAMNFDGSEYVKAFVEEMKSRNIKCDEMMAVDDSSIPVTETKAVLGL